MSSIRRKLQVNMNGSQNTRLDIAGSGYFGDWRVDVLAHMSRYNRIADLIIDESRHRHRPLALLDIGCGDLFPLKCLQKAHVIRKQDVVASYLGVDIDPAVEINAKEHEAMLRLMLAELLIKDLTIDPCLPLAPASIDFCWSTECIEHMQPQFVEPWLEEVDRCMQPGGLVYISTPNRDGSNKELPLDHVYEWGFEELKSLLTKLWTLESVTGTFIKLPTFYRLNRMEQRIPPQLVALYEDRFDGFWLRNVLAAPYPEHANNCAWILRKPT